MGQKHLNSLTAAGLLVTLGIIFGDIGTSPLYVLKAIIGQKNPISESYVLGGLSCIFWTLTLQTTLKYVIITLKADNNGEGGIFSLYALVRRLKRKGIHIFAIIGGSALLADGIITPPISVASAIEGLRIFNPEIQTVPIILCIIVILFLVQQFGTKLLGSSFGPIMLLWFTMLAVLGIPQILQHPEVFKAISPMYAVHILMHEPQGFWVLGAVFLCTTGAEALYSDLGHCGRRNIRVSWSFVKTCLLLNYFGQGAWLIAHKGEMLGENNPFFLIMPQWFVIFGVIMATVAAVIASQALITGSYTLITEAMRLNFWPKVKIEYPTTDRGQMYVPSLNKLLLVGCICVVLLFQESSNMEAAYGLSITITMLMTTILLSNYLITLRLSRWIIYVLLAVYLAIEGGFLIANLSKFAHGGWFTLMIGTILISVMITWFHARKIKNRFTEFTDVDPYLPIIKDLSGDTEVAKYATNLVYLTSANYNLQIERKVIYSILNKHPKRADIYWFVHVDVVDHPKTMEYTVEELIPGVAFRIDFRLGFRVEPKINVLFKEVVDDLVQNKEINIVSRYPSLKKHGVTGDFRFVVIDRILNFADYDLPWYEKVVMQYYSLLKWMSLTEQRAFGLDTSLVTVENVPLVITPPTEPLLKRVEHPNRH